jgi:flagellar protein FliO/FliZ
MPTSRRYSQMKQRLLLLLSLTLSLPLLLPSVAVMAAENVGQTDVEGKGVDIFNTAYLFQVFGSLLVVFGCIFGLIFLLKKMNGMSPGQKAPVRVLGVTRIGSREKILLVEAGSQQLLVGVSAGNIRTLHTFEEPVIDSSEAGEKKADFSSLLGSTFTPGKTK